MMIALGQDFLLCILQGCVELHVSNGVAGGEDESPPGVEERLQRCRCVSGDGWENADAKLTMRRREEVTLTTHECKGVSEKDVQMAHAMDDFARRGGYI